jgi:three-Cys-motif partner protein
VAARAKFFEEREDQSEVKARIVSKYFFAWANVVYASAQKSGGKIAYIDLFAGPGRYKDGSASTPLMVLERAIADEKLRGSLVAIFNLRYPLILRDPESASEGRVLAEKFCVSLDEGP